MLTLAFQLGPIAFEQPIWLLLAPACWVLTIWIGRQSLSGMGTASRRVALVIRLAVILLVVGAIARPQWSKPGKGVNVTIIVDESDSNRQPRTNAEGKFVDFGSFINGLIDQAAEKAKPDDTVARVTAARKAYVQSLPAPPRDKPDSVFYGAADATNLADAVTMGMAIMPATSANRLLIISDGNETTGNVLAAANAAKAAGVPIDVLPLPYKYDNEIMVERIVAPASARMGQNINLRVVINATKPATGRINLLVNGDAVSLAGFGESVESGKPGEKAPSTPAPGGDTLSMPVSLDAGTNIITIPIALPLPGPQRFEAIFTPDDPRADAIEQNNRSLAVTFVQSEGRVLVLSSTSEEVSALTAVLTEARLAVEVKSPLDAPATLVDWGAYDAVVLANVPAFDLSQKQQEDLRSYVHDLGGGLIVTGGPDSFGAGGWLGSPMAEALPIKLDPPQKRQMPRGALVMLMHSCEAPQGNYWGQQTCLAAVNNLSRADLAGVLEFSFGHGDWWVHPLSEVGNKAAVTRAINSLTFGDMPSFDNLLGMAYTALTKADAGAKHVIIISDGDPQLTRAGLLADYKAANISISTVLIYPHNRAASGGYDWETMRKIPKETGGRFYPIIEQGDFAKLPAIFIKEAQVVKRALIWEGTPFSPTVANAVSEPMRGLTAAGIPAIEGYIVAGEREGLSVVTLRGKENDPVLAHWQFGLGKSVAFTSDISARWAKRWPSWGKFRAFWEQHIRWAMRPGGTADVRVQTEDLGEQTKLIVEALDAQGERLNFVRFQGRVIGPGGKAESVELRQTGPGRYEGVVETSASGAYVANLRYSAPGENGLSREGSIQAAISKPYADEYRALQDNSALLRQVAERTGGRVIQSNSAAQDLWSREGLTMPVSLRPIWITIVLMALGAFLMDVAVRRVRIDPVLIAGMIRKGLGQGATTANQQLGSLKEARERAQQGKTKGGDGSATKATRPRPQAGPVDGEQAGRKFEVSPEELKAAGKLSGDILSDGPAPKRRDTSAADRPTGDATTKEEGGLARLKKARERAQEQFEDDKDGRS